MMLKNKVALVTGASRGIGEAIVRMLAQEGCQVAFSYFKNEFSARRIAQDLNHDGLSVKASPVDVRDFVAVKSWVDQVRAEFGRIDILVNNAGIIVDKALMLMTPQDWADVIDTNLTGVFNASRSCIVSFMKQKSGQIVNISSVSGLIGLPRQINYSASKGGVTAFTKALAKEAAPYGIRVNAVAPGYIETDILAGLSAEYRQRVLEDIPLGRIGSVADVAACVQFLLSDYAAYMTGQIIYVDGGLAIR